METVETESDTEFLDPLRTADNMEGASHKNRQDSTEYDVNEAVRTDDTRIQLDFEMSENNKSTVPLLQKDLGSMADEELDTDTDEEPIEFALQAALKWANRNPHSQ